MRLHSIVIAALTTAGVLACGRSRSDESSAAGELRIMLDTTTGARNATILVLGLSDLELEALRRAPPTSTGWHQLLRVNVAGQDSVAVAGRYVAGDSALVFHPLFPFDRGRSYAASFDPRHLSTSRVGPALSTTLTLPTTGATPSTTVVRILPTAGEVPENLLRLYIEFSAPMSRAAGLGFVKLLDDAGREVPAAILPLDADFWNSEHTRYTIFLDPGRVKRGILPNEQMGRALRAGRTYTLEIDARWADANGLSLAAPYRRAFRAGPAHEAPMSHRDWQLRAPSGGTRDPLVVVFPEPLDHGLLQRALGVRQRGRQVAGEVAVGGAETEWRFTPQDVWRAGDYELIVLSILEDLAGNRIGRAFEVDMFDRVATSAAAERFTLPFTVR